MAEKKSNKNTYMEWSEWLWDEDEVSVESRGENVVTRLKYLDNKVADWSEV